MPVHVDVATIIDDEVVEAFARLIPQLSSSNPPPTKAELESLVSHEACHLLLCRDTDTGQIIGTTTLAVFPIPTAVRAWIEDVVVDGATRGTGAGAALTNAALLLAQELGAKTVDLTSRPSREAANRLYQRLGFELRTTNCYRYDLAKNPVSPDPQPA
jgi:ribosomal protein S18 acetylase RimI-like enzyme